MASRRAPLLRRAQMNRHRRRRQLFACLAAVLLTTAALVSLPASAASATTIYLAPGGSDTAAGTSTAPIKTLTEAQARVRAALAPSWSMYSGQVRVATIGANLDFDQLFVSRERQILARYPNYDPTKRLGGYASDAIDRTRVARWAHPETAARPHCVLWSAEVP